MTYINPPASHPALAISGSTDLFLVNRVFCVGRNYAAHAREMGMDPDREPPFFFMKPYTAVIFTDDKGINIPYPAKTKNYQHEVELVVAIGEGGFNISADQAQRHIYGYAIGLDMTRRDLQTAASKKGHPWEFGKSFLLSAPIGTIYPASTSGHITDATISLQVNGMPRQHSNINQLTWTIPQIIAHLTQYEPLQAGDLIMTGTPEGVGPVIVDDEVRACIDGLGEIVIRITV